MSKTEKLLNIIINAYECVFIKNEYRYSHL